MGLTWIYKDEPYDETPDEYQGFVYVITELDTDKKYLGKKKLLAAEDITKEFKKKPPS